MDFISPGQMLSVVAIVFAICAGCLLIGKWSGVDDMPEEQKKAAPEPESTHVPRAEAA